MLPISPPSCFFFFNDTATTEISTLSLHDALPISVAPSWDPCSSGSSTRSDARFCRCCSAYSFSRGSRAPQARRSLPAAERICRTASAETRDRKRTRLNSSHDQNSYAVFCLKKKNQARAYYDSHRNEFTTLPTVTLREILVAVPTDARCVNVAAEDAARQRADELRARGTTCG